MAFLFVRVYWATVKMSNPGANPETLVRNLKDPNFMASNKYSNFLLSNSESLFD